MEARRETLLKLIIENYIDRAEPVGSKLLISDLDVSGATIRNEMRALEQEGFLTHPHTSAGRIPTEKGYQYYVEKLARPGSLKKKHQQALLDAATGAGSDPRKNLAKALAEITGNGIILALNPDSVYYTGMASLFSQPEFRDYAHVVNFSTIFDHCEERLADLYELIDGEYRILVGNDNPLGQACSLIGTRINADSLLAILGPMRMDYATNVGLIQFTKQLLK
ncbi:MAG TPA: hypothetical protein VJB37_02155 [Patescibacteria group bacterium]|nr:hypothetical protein [Patescibacteria group bacterium]